MAGLCLAPLGFYFCRGLHRLGAAGAKPAPRRGGYRAGKVAYEHYPLALGFVVGVGNRDGREQGPFGFSKQFLEEEYWEVEYKLCSDKFL